MKHKRLSPVQFAASESETIRCGDWRVVHSYEDEGEGPWLVDLSHLQRWDYQHSDVTSQSPFGLCVPGNPGETSVLADFLVSRMNTTQVSIWHLGRSDMEVEDPAMTDISDAHCMLAVVGRGTQAVMEQVSILDLFNPRRPMPFLTQGPVLKIPCQVVTLGTDCILMTFSRGYGQTFAEALLHASSGCGIRPAGENVFRRFMGRLQVTGPITYSLPLQE